MKAGSWYRPPPHIGDLLGLLGDPAQASAMSMERWDVVVRTARRLRLLATLGARLRACVQWQTVPAAVRAQFDSALATARFRRQKVIYEMDAVRQALGDFHGPLILLKGAAYIAQDLEIAHHRVVGDLDLLVAREHLDEVEKRLLDKGWESLKPEAYDQHYYRAWSHELPPIQFPGHSLEVDLHHNILPPTGRVHPQAEMLVAAAHLLPGTRFHVLHPADQVLHAAVHLFQDSDCLYRARDLVDLDSLLRTFAVESGFWDVLLRHAREHGLSRSLDYALDCANAILRTPVPQSVQASLAPKGPSAVVRGIMRFLLPKALFTEHPEHPPDLGELVARAALFLRAFWLRMPFFLLIRHSVSKLLRSLPPKP